MQVLLQCRPQQQYFGRCRCRVLPGTQCSQCESREARVSSLSCPREVAPGHHDGESSIVGTTGKLFAQSPVLVVRAGGSGQYFDDFVVASWLNMLGHRAVGQPAHKQSGRCCCGPCTLR